MPVRPIAIALLLLAAAAAYAGPPPACLQMEEGWIRLPPAPRPMLAGFGRIANRCGDTQVVVAVRSPRFGEVSLHETRLVDGVSRMRELEKGLEIPAGATVSYAQVAGRIGAPGSVRAVAQACAANTIAVAIPCHRVIRNDGGLSGYRWGIERKRALLEREAV